MMQEQLCPHQNERIKGDLVQIDALCIQYGSRFYTMTIYRKATKAVANKSTYDLLCRIWNDRKHVCHIDDMWSEYQDNEFWEGRYPRIVPEASSEDAESEDAE